MSAEDSHTPSNLAPHVDAGTDAHVSFPAPFGSYLLLHRIGRGGMGDVFLAKTGGVMGIEKHCVVKTLRGRFGDDPQYVDLFVTEARLVVQLSHRNIAQVFDVGRVGAHYYLAMELVLGRNLRAIADELGARRLPPAGAAHIAAELLDALDYAHRAVDASTGEPLHLVHRDVSPQNTLVNFEGEVKLIDFGLAETGRMITSAHSHSGSQEVMGKLAYMAPEHARGEIVDARADQFSAAIVIYELFANERYYAGHTSQDTWRIAGMGTHLPRRFAELDEELQRVLRRALSAEKADRYPSCGDFRDAILEYARKRAYPHGGPLLRTLMNETFARDLEATRELLRRFATISARPLPGVTPVPASAPATATDFFSIATSTQAQALHDPTEPIVTSPGTVIAPDQRRSRAPLLAAAAAIVAVAAAALVVTREDGPAVAPADVSVATAPVATAPSGVASTQPPSAPVEAAPPAADAGPSASLAAVEPAAVETEPEPEPVAATPNARKRPPKKTAATTPAALTLVEKIALLKRCVDPCAPPIVKWEGRLSQHPDVGAFKKDLETCSRRCAKR